VDARYRGDLDELIAGSNTTTSFEQVVLDIAARNGLSEVRCNSTRVVLPLTDVARLPRSEPWVYLARAAHGRPGGAPYQDVLAVARAAVARGGVSFPLDLARYTETWKRWEFSSRRRLVTTMIELSDFHSIAPAQRLLPAELDVAIKARYGTTATPRSAQVFGRGVNHAVGGGLTNLGLDMPGALAPGVRAELDQAYSDFLEEQLLLGPHDFSALPAGVLAIMDKMTQDVEFAEGSAALEERMATSGYGRGERLRRVVSATELRDILRPLIEALSRSGLDPDGFIDSGREAMSTFIDELPTRSLTSALRYDKFASQQAWEPNDLDDIVALPIAAVHCDVVVTEDQWVSSLRRAGVPARFNTTLLSDLRQLTPLLTTAA